MTDDGQSPSEILQEIMKRRNTNPSTSTNNPATVDPNVLLDSIERLKRKLQSGKATVPGVNDGTQEDDCITPKQDDATKRYDRAMKGIL